MRVFAEIVGGIALLGLIALAIVLLRAWPIEATLKATTSARISIAMGVSFAGISASAAAILDGPGVVAVHLRTRQLWRKAIPHISVETALAWIEEQISKPKAPKGRFSRFLDWLVARTDKSALPDLGLRVLADLRDLSLGGHITCGFSDPALTGKAAAVLYPLAGVLSPLGRLDIDLDWSGTNRLDADVELSCRFVPARAIAESLRFARRHVHPLQTAS